MNRFVPPTFTSAMPSVLFTLAVILVKWKFHYDPQILLFLVGALIGLFLLEILEMVFPGKPSLFRTVIGELVFIPLSFFVISSSTSILGSALVLIFFLRILTEQLSEYTKTKRLASWVSNTSFTDNKTVESALLVGGVILFTIETVVFVAF